VKFLRDRLSDVSGRFLWGARGSVALDDLLRGSSFGGRLPELSGRSVLVATRDQLATALALIELDGVVRRLVICPSDLAPKHLPAVISNAGVDAIVSDHDLPSIDGLEVSIRVHCNLTITPSGQTHFEHCLTEWILLTSGTTGAPKMLMHNLAGLTATTKFGQHQDPALVWGCFYTIQRFAGLQVFFQALGSGGSFVLPSLDEPLNDYLIRLAAHRATHLSGTPSQWRRVLMSPSASALAPIEVRLAGEIVDQAILDNLHSFYPQARIMHIYASTEAGVGFSVRDGLEGFPASMVGAHGGEVEFKVEDGTLRIRSARIAGRYVGAGSSTLTDDEGFVDTGDNVELRGDRYHFLGRKGGVINVGGLKVHPEEVEAVINRHPDVQMSLVRSRKNPMTGSIVVADVVLKEEIDRNSSKDRMNDVKREILHLCQYGLAPYKVPAQVYFVSALDVAVTGKLSRNHA
jgi:acyl-coenzyme A synthetase/AMP-(fatty) acid ligase